MTGGIGVRGLACRYEEAAAPALAGVDLDVPRGTFVVVMGASGAGKTTLARCLTRIAPCFTPATIAGEVRLDGVSVASRRPGELAGTIGMVFQDFEAQLFSTDVTQEVVFGLEHTGVAPDAMPARVDRALAMVGLAGFEGRDPTTLSGGEKQRLAIAGLLAMRPGIMVFDEPTTDLDPAGRAEVIGVLSRLRREGLAVLLVDHDPASAIDADRVVVLQRGRVVAAGTPAAVLGTEERCTAAGIRAPDAVRVFGRLGVPDPPLDPVVAADRLRELGWTVRPPAVPDAAPAMRAPLVVVEALGHRFADDREALSGVSFALGAGELVALVGRNGSGKTTLARHLNGLLQPTAGAVHHDGHALVGLPLEEVAQTVGYVFQDPDHQLFAGSVRDEIAFGPRNLGWARRDVEARVEEVLSAVGLEAHADEDPFLLDKGARQRLAVGAVLALRPRVLVLDEPTTGLDWVEQRRMLELVRATREAGTTVLLVTHTPWVVAEYAERVLLLERGRLVYDGPVRPFLADEGRLATAGFEPPGATRIGRRLGCTPRSVDELVAWLVPGRPR